MIYTKRTQTEMKLREEMERDISFNRVKDERLMAAYRSGYQQGMGRALNMTLPYNKEEWKAVQKLNRDEVTL